MTLWPADACAYEVPRPRPQPAQEVTWEVLAQRRDREGLPADRETAEHLIAEGRWFYTAEEETELRLTGRELARRAESVFEEDPDAFAGIKMNWIDGRRVVEVAVTRELDHYRSVLEERLGADRVTVTPARFSERELHALQERIVEDHDELDALGIEFLSVGVGTDNRVKVEYCGADENGSANVLRERYGPPVRPVWIAATRMRDEPHSFGSWIAEGRELTVFYALPLNGEQPGSCTAEEHPNRIVVHLTLLGSHGARSLVGGFKPSRATVTLAAPVAERDVIDGTTGERRRRWTGAFESDDVAEEQAPALSPGLMRQSTAIRGCLARRHIDIANVRRETNGLGTLSPEPQILWSVSNNLVLVALYETTSEAAEIFAALKYGFSVLRSGNALIAWGVVPPPDDEQLAPITECVFGSDADIEIGPRATAVG